MNPLYVLDTSPLSDIWFSSIFSHSLGYFFLIFLMHMSFYFDDIQCIYFLLFFFFVPFVLYRRNHWLIQSSKDFCLKKFIALTLIFRSVVHFLFIFIYDIKYGSNFSLLHVVIHLSQEHLLKRLFSTIEFSWHPYQKSIEHKCMDLFLDSQLYSTDEYVYPYASTTFLDYTIFVVSFE